MKIITHILQIKIIASLAFLILFATIGKSQPNDCYTLIWSDEFNGTSLDLNKWSYQNGGWNGSNVQNCYAPENTSVSDGRLKITAQHDPGYDCFNSVEDFTSGFVQTKDRVSWTFGYFEARIKAPASNSTWPAFWMSPQDPVYGAWPQSGEIDIVEIKGHDMTNAYGNAHWGNSATDRVQNKGTYAVNDADNWHVYAVEWQLGELKFYIDGNHYHTINNFNEPNAGTHPQPFDIPFYLRLNMAVGGDYLSAPYNDANNGIDQLPAVMEVDWVRVYQKENNCTTTSPCELIVNHNFENGTENWTLRSFNGADGNISVTNDGYLKVEATTPGTSDWHLGIRQQGFLLENGKTYEVNYMAYADTNRPSDVIIHHADGTQYHYHAPNLSTTPSTYSFQFTMDGTTDSDAVISLNSGSSDIPVYYDNISITPLDCDPLAICEIIQNKYFNSNTENWEVKNFNGAAGNLSVTNNGFLKVEVTTAGTSNWHLGARQRGLLLENGKVYNVSYDAYADANRPSNVIVGKTDGTQYYYHDQALTTTPTTYSFQFTMSQATNTDAMIIFNSGAAAISSYYDNISITPSDCDPCSVNLNIANQDIYPDTYQVSQNIFSNAKVATPDCVIFQGQEILLEAGFEVEAGAKFEVEMVPCLGN